MRYLKNKAGGKEYATTKLQINRRRLHRIQRISSVNSFRGRKEKSVFSKTSRTNDQCSCDSNFHFGKSRKNVDHYRSNCIMHFSIVCVAQAKKIMKRGIRKTILKMIETEGLPFAEEITLTFTEDQIIEITKGQEVKVDYQKVENVCETETAFYIYISSIEALIIPKRVLNQDMEKKLIRIVTENFAHLISINK